MQKLRMSGQVWLMVDGQCLPVVREPMNEAVGVKRRPGRPKTKEYRTLSVRIPKEMHDRLERYYAQAQCTLSELVRQAVEFILGPEYPPNRPRPPATRYVPILSPPESIQAHADEELVSKDMRLPPNRVLGKLCPRKHDYQGTGKSLLALPKRHCLACRMERSRAARAARNGAR